MLSQDPLQHLHNLRQKDLAPFDQAHHHAHVLKNRMRPGQRSWVGRGWQQRSLAPSRIEIALFDLALRLSVVIDAATSRLTLAMSLRSEWFAGRWVILAVATRLTRLAGWVILNPLQPGICAPWPDPDLVRAQSVSWTSLADAA